MPIRGFALSTLMTALALVAAGSVAWAQTREQPRLGPPVVPPASRGVAVGLPDDDTSFVLAQLAMESNRWAPCCEPPSPTKGLWDGCPPSSHFPSWQECWMSFRDGLGWVFTRPVCSCNVSPPSDASAWDWLAQWMPHLGGVSTGCPCMSPTGMSPTGGASCDLCP